MFKASLINLFVAPLTVRMARAMAKSHGAQDFFHQGLAVYCPAEHVALLKESLDAVADFYGADWPRYCRNLQRIIVDKEISSALWFAARTLLVCESDANRMGSVVHMAGWLVADFQRVQALKKAHALQVIRSRKILAAANESGKRMRDQFLAQR